MGSSRYGRSAAPEKGCGYSPPALRVVKDCRLLTGFTLVETLLAIAILSMAIVAPLGIASSGIAAATAGKDRLIAVELAQDGIEVVRNIRDQNRLQGVSWLSGLGACIAPASCLVDSLKTFNGSDKILAPPLSVLKMKTNTGIYGHRSGVGWSDSKYTRSVTVTETPAGGKEVVVIATVTWQTIFSTKKVELVDHLMNW